MIVFKCECGTGFEQDQVPEYASGLLKSLHAQVDLEYYQAQELAKLFEANSNEREKWVEEIFGPEYPKDFDLEELIVDFLYKSHRQDGCTETFLCPDCGRLATLFDVNDQWKFYKPDGNV